MELIALDNNFSPYKFLNFVELQWNRKFYEPGEFSVQLLASEYDAGMKYIFLNGRTELGLIQKIEYKESNAGQYVQLSGYFSEKVLDEKISFPTYQGNNKTISRFMFEIWMSFIEETDLATAFHLSLDRSNSSEINAGCEKISKMTTGDHIGAMLHETFQPQKVSFRSEYNITTAEVVFSLVKGRDLTQDNEDGNNFVVFSESFGNMTEAVYTEDNSNYKNYAIVQGEGEGAERVTVHVDQSGGGLRRQVYVDARDLRQEEGVSQAQYEELLRQRGIEKLLEHVDITNVETTVSVNNGFRYLEDYDLGDTVDIVINSIKKSFTAQIIEVEEVIKGTNHRISITFGDEIPSVWKKARIS